MVAVDVRSLELFLAVSEKQSISKAAQENYVSRQALTEAMNRLEDELDVQLFVRSHQGVTLTPEGRFLAERLFVLKPLWRSTLEGLKGKAPEPKVVRIGLPLFLFSAKTLATIVGLSAEYPQFAISIVDCSSETALSRLGRSELEVAVTWLDSRSRKFVAEPVGSAEPRALACVSASSPLARKHRLTAADFAGQNLLALEADTLAGAREVEYCRSAGARLTIVPRSHSYIVGMIEDDAGAFLLPSTSASQFSSSRIKAVPVVDFPKVLHQSVVRLAGSSREVGALARRLGEVLTREAGPYA
ncbi:LysR family transcriptional regulator [Enterorhabdus sp. P55]|nr:LysR family transcriptional regulator [Enterorhabdus sp. P55]